MNENTKSYEFEEIINSILDNGRVGVLTFCAMSSVIDSGLVGFAAVTAAMLMLGPLGIITGITIVALGKRILGGITTFGTRNLVEGIVEKKLSRGEAPGDILKDFENPIVSQKIKSIVAEKLKERGY